MNKPIKVFSIIMCQANWGVLGYYLIAATLLFSLTLGVCLVKWRMLPARAKVPEPIASWGAIGDLGLAPLELTSPDKALCGFAGRTAADRIGGIKRICCG